MASKTRQSGHDLHVAEYRSKKVPQIAVGRAFSAWISTTNSAFTGLNSMVSIFDV